jgi:hypothetical protein
VLVLRVLPFVLAATLRNRVRHQLRRLRQPKYAIATAVGLAWFWFYAGRHLVAGPSRVGTMPPEAAPVVGLAIAAGGTALLLLAWLLRARHQALAMSEAEVQFLFPAPLSRVQVLHYRVLQLLAQGLVGTAFTTILFGRAASGTPILFALGAWIAFATADLHRLGVALTWAAVGEGAAGLRRRAGTFALLVAAVAFTAWAATRVAVPPPGPPLAWLGELARAVLESPLRFPLWPGLTLAGLVLSRTAPDFLAHLPGALALLALHYAWVVRSGVAFEEAALHASERRARLREARRTRGGVPSRRGPRRAPFRLAPAGRPEVAFVWKALIASGWGRLAGWRGAALAAAVLALAAWLASPAGARAARVAGPMALAAWGAAVLFGPFVSRADLRRDRQSLDVLRALPVSGTRVVRGEILGAAASAVLVQWALLPLAAAGMGWMTHGAAPLWLAAGAAVLGPALAIVHLVLRNAVVVLLPGWVPRENERATGPEATGLGIVVAVGGLIALSLLVLPAGLAAALVVGAGWAALGTAPPPLLALAAWAAAAILLAEAWLATRLLGAAFDRLDPSDG